MNTKIDEGIRRYQENDYSSARRIFKKIINKNKRDHNALRLLGLVENRMGNKESAVNLIMKAISINPDIPSYYKNMGDILSEQSRYDDAVEYYGLAISKNSKYTSAYSCNGIALYKKGDLGSAINMLNKAISINHQDAEAHNNLGIIWLEEGKFIDAIKEIEISVRIDQSNIEYRGNLCGAYNRYGNQLMDEGDIESAIGAYSKAINVWGMCENAYNGLGNAFRELHNIEKARQAFEKAIEINNMFWGAYHNLGNLLSDIGNSDEALQCYQRCLEIDPGRVGTYLSIAKNMKFRSKEEDELRSMEKVLSDDSVSNDSKIEVYFAAGKAYEDLKMFTRSMDLIICGNKTKRRSIDYDIDRDERFFERIIKTYSKSIFDSCMNSGHDSKIPIFVVGMPRSGTSLVEQILASHPAIYGAGELDLLSKIESGACLDNNTYPECVPENMRDTFSNMGKWYIDNVRKYVDRCDYVVDKMPHNFLRIGLIKLILPHATIVHCKRDPMDTCLSIYKHYFSGEHNYAYDMEELGRYYNLYVRLMNHWKKIFGDDIYDLSYENLVKNKEEEVAKMISIVGVQWDDSLMEFYKTKRLVGTASNIQVTRPIYSSSIGLWKKYGDRLDKLYHAVNCCGEQ